jgi:hypothetical protein
LLELTNPKLGSREDFCKQSLLIDQITLRGSSFRTLLS